MFHSKGYGRLVGVQTRQNAECMCHTWFTVFDTHVNGNNCSQRRVSTHAINEDFTWANIEFRGLHLTTAIQHVRAVSRFSGCAEFRDEARNDLPNMNVTTVKHGLLNRTRVSNLLNATDSYIKSLQRPFKHLVDYMENAQRVWRSFGGLTTGLCTISRALAYAIAARRKTHEVQRQPPEHNRTYR